MKLKVENFGLKVKFYKNRLQLSQEKLAVKADLHRTYVSAVERGERNICLINIFKLADALGVEARDLFDEDLDIKSKNL